MSSPADRTIRLRWDINPRHAHVTVFTGPDSDHLANVGTLTFDLLDAVAFCMTVCQGIQGPGFTGMFESGWHDDDD